MNWQPITTAPKNGSSIVARDDEGYIRWTWFEDGDWVITPFQDDYGVDVEQVWEPIEWTLDRK